MCYEFVYDCNSLIVKNISVLCDEENFFLICMGQLNYFYCNDRRLVGSIKELFSEKGIHLFRLSEYEMKSVINHATTAEYQKFSGDRSLFEMFQETSHAV